MTAGGKRRSRRVLGAPPSVLLGWFLAIICRDARLGQGMSETLATRFQSKERTCTIHTETGLWLLLPHLRASEWFGYGSSFRELGTMRSEFQHKGHLGSINGGVLDRDSWFQLVCMWNQVQVHKSSWLIMAVAQSTCLFRSSN